MIGAVQAGETRYALAKARRQRRAKLIASTNSLTTARHRYRFVEAVVARGASIIAVATQFLATLVNRIEAKHFLWRQGILEQRGIVYLAKEIRRMGQRVH